MNAFGISDDCLFFLLFTEFGIKQSQPDYSLEMGPVVSTHQS
jgi:hypothetical protein